MSPLRVPGPGGGGGGLLSSPSAVASLPTFIGV